MNQLKLHAHIVQLNALRYTPAGVPVLELVLKHQSTLEEAGVSRAVQFEIKAMIIGNQAETLALAARDLETCFEWHGFLAASRNGKGIVVHIQDFSPL